MRVVSPLLCPLFSVSFVSIASSWCWRAEWRIRMRLVLQLRRACVELRRVHAKQSAFCSVADASCSCGVALQTLLALAMWRMASATRRRAATATHSAAQAWRTRTDISTRTAADAVSHSAGRCFGSRNAPFTEQEQAQLQEAMRRFVGEAEAEPPRKPALPRPSRADLSVLVRASPIFELSYTSQGEHCTAIWMMHDAKWLQAHRADADLLVTNASSLELLTITRQPRQLDAQQQARQAALDSLVSRGAKVDSALASSSLVAALLSAARQLSPASRSESPSVTAASAAIAGLNLVQLGPMWANHSRDALRLFLRSFVQHVQDNAALQLRTESELNETKPAATQPPQSIAPATTAARDPTSLLPLLQPQSLVDAGNVRIPSLRSSKNLLATLPPQSRDERYRAFVRLSLEQMLRTLYPDPQTAKDAAETEEFLQRRRAYAAQLQWPPQCAEDSAEFARRFLTPRRIELHVQVNDTVNAYEQQMLMEWFRQPGDFTPAAKPRIEGRLAARRSVAGQIVAVQQRMPGGAVSPAPFSSLLAASLAASNLDQAELRSPQVASLFDTLSRDQAVLHSAPLFGEEANARPARRQVHAMFHSRMRTALIKQRTAATEQPASYSTLNARDTNQRFLDRFSRGPIAAPVPPNAGEPSMPELLSSVDAFTLQQLHDATLSALSRDLDIPVCAIRHALLWTDLAVRAAYRRELNTAARKRGFTRWSWGQLWKQKQREQRMAQPDTQTRPPVFDDPYAEQGDGEALGDDLAAAAADEAHEMDGDQEEDLEKDHDADIEEDLEEEIDDAAARTDGNSQSVDVAKLSPSRTDPPFTADVARELDAEVHTALMSGDVAYSACDGVFVSVFPLSGGRLQGYKRDLERLRLDVATARRNLGLEHLRRGVNADAQQTPALEHFSPNVASNPLTTPIHAPRFYREGRSAVQRLQSGSSSPSPPSVDARAVKSRRLADDFASLMLSHLSQVVPGGVRITTESWLSQYASPVWSSSLPISTPDMLLLDDVSLVVHYPRLDDPQRPQPRRATRMVPMRWLEVKNSYGAFMHYRATQQPNPMLPVTGTQQNSSAANTWASPSRAALVEQSSRYAALFGPGCVVFGRGFCDAWLRPCGTTPQADVPMPDDVNFLDANSLVQVIKAELKRE